MVSNFAHTAPGCAGLAVVSMPWKLTTELVERQCVRVPTRTARRSSIRLPRCVLRPPQAARGGHQAPTPLANAADQGLVGAQGMVGRTPLYSSVRGQHRTYRLRARRSQVPPDPVHGCEPGRLGPGRNASQAHPGATRSQMTSRSGRSSSTRRGQGTRTLVCAAANSTTPTNRPSLLIWGAFCQGGRVKRRPQPSLRPPLR